MTRDDHDELEALLRQPTERLAPPDGSWEHIRRRAGRRKWAKASLAVVAGVVVIAGAVPAVIAVRHTSDNQSLSVVNTPGPKLHHGGSPAPAPAISPSPALNSTVAGFFPDSLSFISKAEGFAWGSIGASHRGTVAYTPDDGATWTRLPASPRVDNGFVDANGQGDGQIRFASANLGFVYGAKLFVTQDRGGHWQQVRTPGYVDDLEAMNHRIWALVQTCQHCKMVQLYSATVGDPSLHRVKAVGEMRAVQGTPSMPGTASIAVDGPSVDVLVGSSGFWSTPDGTKWTELVDPCQSGPGGSNVTTSLVSASSTTDIIAACGYNASGGSEVKQIHASTDSGSHWALTPAQPASAGYLQTLAAGTVRQAILGTSRGGAQVTTDGGATWRADSANGVRLSFVGFISNNHVVALADRSDESQGAFATSKDAGKHWSVTPFPN